MEYTIHIDTIPGIADDEYIDRLAAILYERADFVDLLLALNENDSVSATFGVAGPNPLAAAQRAVETFANAAAEAGPKRLPSGDEVGRGNAVVGELAALSSSVATVGAFAVEPAIDREAALA